MNFKPEEWICVLDKNIDKYSNEQIQAIKDLKLSLHGAIVCSDKDQENNPACKQVPAFPSFCNINTNVCASGLRKSLDHFEMLHELSARSKK